MKSVLSQHSGIPEENIEFGKVEMNGYLSAFFIELFVADFVIEKIRKIIQILILLSDRFKDPSRIIMSAF